MDKPLIVANWKMKGGKFLYLQIIKKLSQELTHDPELLAGCQVVIAPSLIYLSWLQEVLRELPIEVGSQNVSQFLPGAYTGETAAVMLSEMQVKWSLVGHSERRQWYFEEGSTIAHKVLRCLEQGITPIVCVGESTEQRTHRRQFEVIQKQVEDALSLLDQAQVAACYWAYEPVWAIGCGQIADSASIAEMSHFLSELLSGLGSSKAKILYGGSVDSKNALEVFRVPYLSGVLVGSASLVFMEWLGILRQASQYYARIP
ncbi:MAG: triose-phosphate isomerase [Gammaproteobacteria bacterium]|nr:triose-phosphate isomerase [Gammaproteobacteria bacterium]